MYQIFSFLFFLFFSFYSHSKEVTIFHTNDLHSFFKGTYKYSPENRKVERVGGYAQLSQKLLQERKKKKVKGHFTLTTDSGDFYSGTLFHAIAMRADIPLFPEYTFFNQNEYDAITLGNHEFDGKDEGFELFMRKVLLLGNQTPIVSTNFLSQKTAKKVVLKSLLKKLVNNRGETLNVGILGALGPDGCDVSLGNRSLNQFIGYSDKERSEKWNDLVKLLKTEAESLRQKGAELIILLLHGGGEEDSLLAKKIPELDVILAGHTHQKYFKKEHSVLISQAGSYGAFLGELSFQIKGKMIKQGSESVKHHTISSKDEGNEEVSQLLSVYEKHLKKILETENFKNLNNKISFKDNFLKNGNNKLGHIVTDAILSQLRGRDSDIDFYFTANGLIRNPLLKDISYGPMELFNILPIGFHDGAHLGLKVFSFYLTKEEVVHMIDFLDLYGFFKSKAIPAFSSSLSYKKRSWGVPFLNRVYDLKIDKKEAQDLLKVATNSFLYSYMDLITKKTMGLIKLIPKDKEGKPLKAPEESGIEVKYFMEGLLSKTDSLPLLRQGQE